MTLPTKACSACGQRYDEDVIFCPRDGTPLSAKKTKSLDDPYVGLTLAGQITLKQLIGIGAMGRVYRAHQQGIDRDVAVKILHRELLRNPTVKARFLREAKVASRLSHPNVVQVLMTGEVEKVNADVGGEAYMVMEYLDGISLRSALAAEGGSLPLPRALHIILQVCDAVGEAHAQGIVHRDLKPENVMLVKRGDDAEFVTVLDFGVARIDWADSTVATQAGVIFGTARYISPEGAQGKQVGAASDVYSIAIMLFQCLSGRTPFDAESPVGILIKHTNEPAPQLSEIERASYVPKPITDVVMKNLAKDPKQRAENARVLGRLLVAAAREAGLSPDELMVRSTLVSKGTLSLESIQRTKALPLSAELEKKLRGQSGDTQALDAAGGTVAIDEDSPASSPKSAKSGVDPTLFDDTEPPSSVDPTLSDQRPSLNTEVDRISGPGAPASQSEGAPTSASRPSWDPASNELPESVPPPPLERSRLPVVLACFALGALLAFFLARHFGAFGGEPDALTADVQSAQAALDRRAYDEPVIDNVREITDRALRRHPGNPALIAIRRKAADRLRLDAEQVRTTDPDKAQNLAQRALALDPNNEAAQVLLRSTTQPGPGVVKAPKIGTGKPPRVVGGIRPAAAPDAGATDAATPAPSASSPTGGRWL